MKDEQLIHAYRKEKDLSLLEQLYLSYQPRIFRHCISILKNAQDSEDASVEIFLILKEKLIEHDVNHFPSWLFMVSRNHCLKKIRSKSRLILVSEENIIDKGEITQVEDHIEKYIDLLPEAIDKLEESQKWCIVLFYLHGKSYNEIEKLKGYTFNKIKSSIQHGKKNLRKIIMQE